MYCVTTSKPAVYSVDKYSGTFSMLLAITDSDSNSMNRFIQPKYFQDIALDKDGNIFCLEINGYAQTYGAGGAPSFGYVDGRFVYKVDMTDPANPVGDWFTPGHPDIVALTPQNDNMFYGITVDKSGNVYFSLTPTSNSDNPGGIMKVEPDGITCEIIVGDDSQREISDGIGLAARLNHVVTLDADQYNNVYMIDLGPAQDSEASPSNVSRLRVFGLEQGAVTSTFEATKLRADVLSLYEQSNAEVTNLDPVIVGGTPQPILDITPNVSIKNTDNTATGAVLKLSNSRGANAGVNNDIAGGEILE